MSWDTFFWIAVWWMVWFYIFLAWYSHLMETGDKTPVTKIEAFFMFILAGIAPVLAIAVIIGKAIAKNNREDKDK